MPVEPLTIPFDTPGVLVDHAGVTSPSHADIARSVYGLLIVMTVLEAMELHPPHAGWEGAELLLGSLLLVALADAYADAIAGMVVHKHPPNRTELRGVGRGIVPVLFGAPLPLLVLVLSAMGVISIRHAVDLAEIIAYATLLLFGWWMVRNLNPTARVIGGVTMVVIAFVLVALKAAFH